MHPGLLEVEEGVLLVHGAEEQQNIHPGIGERAQPTKCKIKRVNKKDSKICTHLNKEMIYNYINSPVMLIIEELVSFRYRKKLHFIV